MFGRRTLVSGAAWAVPAVMVAQAAPAMAASTLCTDGVYTLVWSQGGTYTRISSTLATYTSTDLPGLVVTLTTIPRGSNLGVGSPNLTLLTTSQVGALGVPGVRLQTQGGVGYDNRCDYVISFNATVTDLSYTLTDIDQGSEEDVSAASPAGFSYSTVSGTTVSGAGTQANPWSGTGNVNNTDDSSGNVTVSYTGTGTSYTVSMWNATSAQGSSIFLANLKFSIPC